MANKLNFYIGLYTFVLCLFEMAKLSSAKNTCGLVSSFTLVNASSRQDIGILPQSINLAEYPANAKFNIRVNVNDTACGKYHIRSVMIKYKESTPEGEVLYTRSFCEKYLPYAVFGDNNPGGAIITDMTTARYFGHKFPNATTTASTTALLQAIPYFGVECKGMKGKAKSQKFVIESGSVSQPSKKPFETTKELYAAVDRWLDGQNEADSELAATYGYPIGLWDVSRITDFSNVFSADFFLCPSPLLPCDRPFQGRNFLASFFNDDISMWNVSNAKTMSGMFLNAQAFNGNLSAWNVSSVTDMNSMFMYTQSFEGFGLSTWDVSSVTAMHNMFLNAQGFQGDISNWDVSNVTMMAQMFSDADSFNGDLSAWDVSKVTNMDYMFASADDFDGDLSAWDVSSVTSMAGMFQDASRFKGDLSKWDMSSVKDLSYMFSGATSFKGDLSSWDVLRVTDMTSMFDGATAFDCDLSDWDVSRVKSMAYMFNNAIEFNGDISSWHVSKVNDMSSMFRLASSFNGDISAWDVSAVSSLLNMFRATDAFNCDLSHWNLTKATDIDGMFLNAVSFDQNLCAWGNQLSAEAKVHMAFGGTNCPDVSDPDFSASSPGPFCHAC